ncbi:MAG: glycosyltransferase family 2 protein [Desulfobulbaceae bacterium]|nr:MAG: glycosyltransferase family 2 protein [Desulfobulbaceae bacterium]
MRKHGRLLIFIVAYNAENTIESVLKRIPIELDDFYDVEILIIDDSSQDQTFARSELTRRSGSIPFKMTVLFNPVNQGYGGNQKIGFHYAVNNGFDWVALVHGDGQYAPECLPQLTEILANNEADAVFGSRMMEGSSALKGGMPLYKFVGNKILTTFQNFLLGSKLSEFHSGYRLYSINALKKIPFDLNSNDFHFDTEIIIQLFISGQIIREIPIPTYYGDEICHVNGMKYALDVCKATIQSKVQRFHILYDRKYDCSPVSQEATFSHQNYSVGRLFLKELDAPSTILIIGRFSDTLKNELENGGHAVHHLTGSLVDSEQNQFSPIDYLVILDDTDLSQRPDLLVAKLRTFCTFQPDCKIVLAVGNIGFFITRILLLFGRFSYTRKGVISLSNFRLFTLRSLKKLLSQNNFHFDHVIGVPIEYQGLFGSHKLSRILTFFHYLFAKLRPSFFAYQFLVVARAKPSLDYLLSSAVRVSAEKQAEIAKSDTV